MSVDGMDAQSIFNTPCCGYHLRDLVALPGHATCNAREVRLETRFSRNIILNSPIVAAPMDTVCEGRMAIICALAGGIGVIHSKCDPAKQALEVSIVKQFENGFIMDPHVLSPSSVVEDVDRIREIHGTSTVLITESGIMGNRLLGMITSRDIDFVEDRKTKLADLMTPKVSRPTCRWGWSQSPCPRQSNNYALARRASCRSSTRLVSLLHLSVGAT